MAKRKARDGDGRRAAIYARFSSHNQRDVSIEIQLDKCREYCEEHGLMVVGEYCDHAQTGTAVAMDDDGVTPPVKALMNGVSPMIPFVVVGSLFIALAIALGGTATANGMVVAEGFWLTMNNIGAAAFGLMYPILAGYIAYSIAGRASFVPLREGSAQHTVRVEHGFVSWLDGEVDLAPSTCTSIRPSTTMPPGTCRLASRVFLK